MFAFSDRNDHLIHVAVILLGNEAATISLSSFIDLKKSFQTHRNVSLTHLAFSNQDGM
jgi:hypothetical protein